MPAGNGTGPLGMGPMTGRGAGYCSGYQVPGFMNPLAGGVFRGRPRAGMYGYYPRGAFIPYGRAPGSMPRRGRGFGGFRGFGPGRGRGRGRW